MKKKWLSLVLAVILTVTPCTGIMAEEALVLDEAADTQTAVSYEGETGFQEIPVSGEERPEAAEDADGTQEAETGEDDSLSGQTEPGDEMAGEELPDEAAPEIGDLQGADAGELLIEDILEVEEAEAPDFGADETEELTEEITGTLRQNTHASDAMLRQYGTYNAGIFLDSYGDQLTGLEKTVYQSMKTEYVTQRKASDLEINFSSAFTFQTTGTVTGGKLNWDKEHNAAYQEIRLSIEYALQSAFDALVYDYPEVFWMGVPDYNYWINYKYSGGVYIGSISSVSFLPRSVEAYSGASAEIAAFDAAVTLVKNSIRAGSTREETVRAIRDYLCRQIVYEENTYAHSAGGVFLHSRGGYNYVVCEGYAKAFKILCGRFGIPCVIVVGDAGGAHMWNYVKMENGNWYLVDVTWDDDPGGDPQDDYFLVGSNTPSAVDSRLDIGTERMLYTNFSGADYTRNFYYPILSNDAYAGSTHQHVWQTAAWQEPTCTESGYYIYRCSCGSISYEFVDAKGHSYRDKKYVYNNDATCLKDGTKTAVCDNGCGTKRQTVYAEGTKLTPTISFSASSLKLKKKQSTSKFQVTFGKGDYVSSWKSSNTKIVKVSGKADGTCTIKAQKNTGNAKITVTLASGLTKTVKVTVQKTAVETTKISGIPKTLSLGKSVSYSLKASVSPFTSKQKVTYTSSNKKVATVSKKGVIKARKKGKATITVKSGKKKVKCKVTVK